MKELRNENVRRALAIMSTIGDKTDIGIAEGTITISNQRLCLYSSDDLEVLEVLAVADAMDCAAREFENAAAAIREAQGRHIAEWKKFSAT